MSDIEVQIVNISQVSANTTFESDVDFPRNIKVIGVVDSNGGVNWYEGAISRLTSKKLTLTPTTKNGSPNTTDIFNTTNHKSLICIGCPHSPVYGKIDSCQSPTIVVKNIAGQKPNATAGTAATISDLFANTSKTQSLIHGIVYNTSTVAGTTLTAGFNNVKVPSYIQYVESPASVRIALSSSSCTALANNTWVVIFLQPEANLSIATSSSIITNTNIPNTITATDRQTLINNTVNDLKINLGGSVDVELEALITSLVSAAVNRTGGLDGNAASTDPLVPVVNKIYAVEQAYKARMLSSQTYSESLYVEYLRIYDSLIQVKAYNANVDRNMKIIRGDTKDLVIKMVIAIIFLVVGIALTFFAFMLKNVNTPIYFVLNVGILITGCILLMLNF